MSWEKPFPVEGLNGADSACSRVRGLAQPSLSRFSHYGLASSILRGYLNFDAGDSSALCFGQITVCVLYCCFMQGSNTL